MHARARLLALGAAAIAASGVIVGAARPRAGAPRLAAAYRVFRDPAVLDPRAPPLPVAVSCARFSEDARVKDVDVARELDRARADDLDDPEGATLATMTMPDL